MASDMNALWFNPLVRALRDRLRERGKAKMAVLGAAMRKLLHIVFGVLAQVRQALRLELRRLSGLTINTVPHRRASAHPSQNAQQRVPSTRTGKGAAAAGLVQARVRYKLSLFVRRRLLRLCSGYRR